MRDAGRRSRPGRACRWAGRAGPASARRGALAGPGRRRAATAAMPSSAPRRITTTNRWSVGADASASVIRPPRPANAAPPPDRNRLARLVIDRRHRRWNSGEVSRSVIASRREPAWRIAVSVASAAVGPSAASASSSGSRSPMRAGEPVGPVDAAHHRLGRGPVGGAVGPAVRLPARSRPAGPDRPGFRAARAGVGGQAHRAQAGDHQFLRRLAFRRRAARQREGRQRQRRGAQIAAGVAQHGLDLAHRVGRRVVGDEVSAQLGGEKRCVAGWLARKRSAGFAAGLLGREDAAHQRSACRARARRRRNRKPGLSPRRSTDQPVRMRAKSVTSAWV